MLSVPAPKSFDLSPDPTAAAPDTPHDPPGTPPQPTGTLGGRLGSPGAVGRRGEVDTVFIVRAEIDPDAPDTLDAWYEAEHLPTAVLGAAGASRGWSAVEEKFHIAFYEFPDLAAVRRMMASDALKGMSSEFNRQ